MVFTLFAAVLTGLVLERFGFAGSVKSVSVVGGNIGGLASVPAPGAGFWEIQGPRIRRAFGFAWSLFKHIFIYLMIGAAIGAVIYGFVPQDLIIRIAGPDNPLAIPIAAVIGIPMYIRAETIIPISAVLMGKGMGVGAVVALIIGGAGMSIPEISLLAAIFKKKLVAVFVTTILIVAVLAGFLAGSLTALNF
jgi:uncharacterized membrane protein YraQ (UPF0718 family)